MDESNKTAQMDQADFDPSELAPVSDKPSPAAEEPQVANIEEPDTAEQPEASGPLDTSNEASENSTTEIHGNEDSQETSGSGQTLHQLVSSVGLFHERSRAQEELIDRMQLQIEALRSDQVKALLKPVVVGLAQLHSDVVAVRQIPDEDLSASRAQQELELFEHQILETLAGFGFESLEAEPGQPFDRAAHSAKRRLETSDPSQDLQIATVRRQGFGAPEDEKPILTALVDVFRYSKNDSVQPTPEPRIEAEQE